MKKEIFAKRYSRETSVIEKERSGRNERVVLRSNFPCSFLENDQIPLYIYREGEKGTVLFLHGRGERNLEYLRWFPENFGRYGLSGAMMILPYHFERTPDGYRSGQLFLDPRTDVLRNRFENAVVDALTSLEYLRATCSPPYYLMGYSFGGFIAVITAAIDGGISGLSLTVTGGNFYHITWKSFVTGVMRVKYEEDGSCNRDKCLEMHGKIFHDYTASLEGPEVELGSAPISCLEYDPLTYARFVRCPTLLTGALFDIFIPKKSTLELSQAIPDCKVKWLPTGHLSSILFKRWVLREAATFFVNFGRS